MAMTTFRVQPPVTLHEYPSGTLVIIELGLNDAAARIALCRTRALTTQVISTLSSIDMTLKSMKIEPKDVAKWSISTDAIPPLSNSIHNCWREMLNRPHRIKDTERGIMLEDEEEIEFDLQRVDSASGITQVYIDRIKLVISPTNVCFMEGALHRVFFLKSTLSELQSTVGEYRVFNELGWYLCSIFAASEAQAVANAKAIGVDGAARAIRNDQHS
jgi:hypothetical protein